MAMLTGIDPGAASIKIVQGRLDGPIFKLRRVIEIPVDPDSDQEVETLQLLQSQVPGLALGKGLNRLGINGRDLMIRYTTVPPVPLWRLRMLMDFEIADMASSSGEELTADYNVLQGSEAGGDETVLVALVKSRFLDARLRALKGANQSVHASTPNCVALFNSFTSFGQIEDGECTFLVDIGDQNLEMAVQKDGELLFARNISGGGSLFTKAIAENWKVGPAKARELKHEFGNIAPRGRASYSSAQEEKVSMALLGVAGQLAGMIQSTMNFAKNQPTMRDLTIGRVLISGGGAGLKGLDAYLEQNLRVPVRRFSPENGLDLSGLPPEELEVFEADPSAFACALGLARMSADPHAFLIDVVPPGEKRRRRFMQRDLWLAMSGVAALVLLAITWFDLSRERDAAAEAKNQAKKKERQAVSVRTRFEEKQREATLVRDKVDALAWKSRGPTWLLETQAMLQKHAPASVWIRSTTLSIKNLTPPGKESEGRKAGVEKIVVAVAGEIRQLGEGVTPTFNKFVEDLRKELGDDRKVEIARRPADSGDDFELIVDFSGWPGAAPEATEGEGE